MDEFTITGITENVLKDYGIFYQNHDYTTRTDISNKLINLSLDADDIKEVTKVRSKLSLEDYVMNDIDGKKLTYMTRFEQLLFGIYLESMYVDNSDEITFNQAWEELIKGDDISILGSEVDFAIINDMMITILNSQCSPMSDGKIRNNSLSYILTNGSAKIIEESKYTREELFKHFENAKQDMINGTSIKQIKSDPILRKKEAFLLKYSKFNATEKKGVKVKKTKTKVLKGRNKGKFVVSDQKENYSYRENDMKDLGIKFDRLTHPTAKNLTGNLLESVTNSDYTKQVLGYEYNVNSGSYFINTFFKIKFVYCSDQEIRDMRELLLNKEEDILIDKSLHARYSKMLKHFVLPDIAGKISLKEKTHLQNISYKSLVLWYVVKKVCGILRFGNVITFKRSPLYETIPRYVRTFFYQLSCKNLNVTINEGMNALGMLDFNVQYIKSTFRFICPLNLAIMDPLYNKIKSNPNRYLIVDCPTNTKPNAFIDNMQKMKNEFITLKCYVDGNYFSTSIKLLYKNYKNKTIDGASDKGVPELTYVGDYKTNLRQEVLNSMLLSKEFDDIRMLLIFCEEVSEQSRAILPDLSSENYVIQNNPVCTVLNKDIYKYLLFNQNLFIQFRKGLQQSSSTPYLIGIFSEKASFKTYITKGISKYINMRLCDILIKKLSMTKNSEDKLKNISLQKESIKNSLPKSTLEMRAIYNMNEEGFELLFDDKHLVKDMQKRMNNQIKVEPFDLQYLSMQLAKREAVGRIDSDLYGKWITWSADKVYKIDSWSDLMRLTEDDEIISSVEVLAEKALNDACSNVSAQLHTNINKDSIKSIFDTNRVNENIIFSFEDAFDAAFVKLSQHDKYGLRKFNDFICGLKEVPMILFIEMHCQNEVWGFPVKHTLRLKPSFDPLSALELRNRDTSLLVQELLYCYYSKRIETNSNAISVASFLHTLMCVC
uniref:NSP7 n=1 Tax=Blackberry latent virus TaxID=3231626 RepID=A0AAU8HZX5_9REOV